MNNMKKILIKTDREIGNFLQFSYIDGKSIREINEYDLININKNEYDIINTDNTMTIDDIIKLKDDMLNKL